MVFGQNMTESELLELVKSAAPSYSARLSATDEWRNTDKDLVDKIFGQQSPVDGRASFREHHFGPQSRHLLEGSRKINNTGAALHNVGTLRYLIQSCRVGIFCRYHYGSLIWSSEQRQRQIKVQAAAHDCDTRYGPRPSGKTSRFGADAARRRAVVLGRSGSTADQNYVREGTYGSEDFFISRSAQGPRDTSDFCDPIDCRNHVHHQPRATVYHRSAIAIGIVGVDLNDRWR